ncbi:MAG: DNA polymerase III subunit delta' [Rhodobacteraceae bacterium]|nr:DNA polymerase III subunit delta' [Paracoccaceae bacterium]
MSDAAPPEADRLEDAPHPRDTRALIGQAAAEAAFLDAYAGGRLHHAWLITGPRGVGKATLAWRIARFLLTEAPVEAGLFGVPEAPGTLDIDPEHPVARRIGAGSESRLFLLRRTWNPKTKRLPATIGVDEARGLKNFFAMSAADGGRRVVIVDAADELTVNAANALLKLLEEPPDRCTILLISHQPARLLPTIRSRCRELRCATLAPDDLARALEQAGIEGPQDAAALGELAAGSVGAAIGLASEDGPGLYASLIKLAGSMPRVDRTAVLKLADSAGARGREARRDLTLRLIDLFLARLARSGSGAAPAQEAAPGEAAELARLSPDPQAARDWAALQQELSGRATHALAVNLDPASLILDMILRINETAANILSRRQAR